MRGDLHRDIIELEQRLIIKLGGLMVVTIGAAPEIPSASPFRLQRQRSALHPRCAAVVRVYYAHQQMGCRYADL